MTLSPGARRFNDTVIQQLDDDASRFVPRKQFSRRVGSVEGGVATVTSRQPGTNFIVHCRDRGEANERIIG